MSAVRIKNPVGEANRVRTEVRTEAESAEAAQRSEATPGVGSGTGAPPCEALNGAAALLLEVLPTTAAQVLRDVAAQTRIHLWMQVVGMLQKSYDTGEHTAPVLDPTWTMTMPSAMGIMATHKCEWGDCGHEFTPRWTGQQYCSNECGTRAANAARIAAMRADALVRHQVGEEPPGTARSTIHADEGHGTAAAEAGGVGAELGGTRADATDPIAAIEADAARAIGA